MTRRSKGPKLNPFSVVENPSTPLQEFIASCGGEVTTLEAIREYQTEWCEHPQWDVVASSYAMTDERHYYFRRCKECGLVERKNGRAVSRAA